MVDLGAEDHRTPPVCSFLAPFHLGTFGAVRRETSPHFPHRSYPTTSIVWETMPSTTH